MEKGSRIWSIGMLLGVGIGIALAVALDNIAIGIAVGVVFVAGSAIRQRRENDQEK